MTSTTLTIRVDSETKNEAKQLFADMGMDISTAVNIFLRQALTDNGMPFVIRRENPESVRARYEAEHGMTKHFASVSALMEDLNDDSSD